MKDLIKGECPVARSRNKPIVGSTIFQFVNKTFEGWFINLWFIVTCFLLQLLVDQVHRERHVQRRRCLDTPARARAPRQAKEQQCADYTARTLNSLLPRHRDAVSFVDVRNEVVAENLAAFVCANGTTLGQSVGGWDATLWQRFRAWANTTRDFDNYRFVQHRLDAGLPQEFEKIFWATKRMYATYLSWLIPKVKQALPTALRLLDALEVVEVEEELRLGHLPQQEEEGVHWNCFYHFRDEKV